MTAQKKGLFDWTFLFNWSLITMVGLVLAPTLRQFTQPLIFWLAGGGVGGQAIEGAVIGLVVGLAQQIALPPSLNRRVGWSLASALGWAVGWSWGWSVGWRLLGGLNFAGIGLIAGLVAGLGQWFILRTQVRSAGWWLLVSPLAWAISLGAGLAWPGQFGWAVAGGLAGLLTGLWVARVCTM